MTEFLVLRLIHILGGIFWVGSGVFSAVYLGPALMSAGPAAGQVMAAMQKRHMLTVMPAVAILTMLSGLRLMWITSAGFSPQYFSTPGGATFAASGAAAITGFFLALLITRPAHVRAGTLEPQLAAAPDDRAREPIAAEICKLRRRAAIGSVVAVWLVVLAAAGMSVARYIR